MQKLRLAALAVSALLLVQTASAVPSGVPKDPPAPPTGLGRLFGQEARLALDNCAVTSQTASNATVGFSSTYPYRFRRFQRSDSTWTSWTTLPTGTTSWDCQGTCFHDTARVEIRGCENSTCATGATSECAILIGVPHNGPPELDWSGIETTSAGVLGCVQSDHTEIVVRLRYAGTHPLSGYPQIDGLPASERVAGRQDAGSVRNRVYAAPAGWTPADIAGGSWTTTVSLDSSGSRDVSLVVELSESCLSSPQAAIVGPGGTLAPIASGQMFIGGSELEIASGNPSLIYALTSHQLSHDGAVEPFGRITPATGQSDTAHTWTETAVGRDGLTYTSPDLDLTAQAIACESDPALVTWWMDNSDNIDLPDSTDWVPGPTILTNACPGVSPPPAPSGNRSVSDARVGTGSVATGWPTEVQALNATGQITELYFWYAGGWDNRGSDWYFYAKRNLVCPDPGERIVGNSCQTCPTYDECTGGSLVTRTHCGNGNPPTDDRRVTYRTCTNNVTTTVNSCFEWHESDPLDQPCSVDCAPGEWDDAGTCRPCQIYQGCFNSQLVSEQWCEAGTPPTDATLVSYRDCNAGTTVTEQACVPPSGRMPADNPCLGNNCAPNEWYDAGTCRPCQTYQTCSGNSLASNLWCEAGIPLPDAVSYTYRTCSGSTTNTHQICLDPGDARPADNPCSTTCGPGERRVGSNCEPCPTYQACTAGDAGTQVSQPYCGSGSPPAPAYIEDNYACYNGSTQVIDQCIGDGGYSSDPGPVPCPGDNCVSYDGCRASSSLSPGYNFVSRWRRCGTGVVTPPAPQVVSRRECDSSNQPFTRWYCIGAGRGLNSLADVPADETCAGSCTDYQACSSAVASNGGITNLQTTAEYCGSGSAPTNARQYTREVCSGSSLVDLLVCVGTGGYRSDPGNAYIATRETCSGGTTVDTDFCVGPRGLSAPPNDAPCQACTDYTACSSSSSTSSSSLLTNAEHCPGDPGSVPANAQEVTRQYCSSTTTRTKRYCVGEGGMSGWSSIPGDNPCAPTPSCEDYTACSSASSSNRYAYLLTDEEHCPGDPGTTPADAYQVTRQVCDSGSTERWRFCIGEGGEDSDPGNNPCQPPPSCEDYKACSSASSSNRYSNLLTDEEHCPGDPGTTPADAYQVTRQVCDSGSTERWRFCVGVGGEISDPGNNPCDTPPPPDCTDYKACSSSSSTSSSSLLTDAEHCGSGNAPTDAREHTRQYCSGTTTRTRRYCVGEGGLGNTSSIPADDPCPACTDYKACSSSSSTSSSSLLTDAEHCGPGNAPTNAGEHTRQYCSGTTTRTRRYCVGEGGLGNTSSIPDDDPCPTCTDYKVCSSPSSTSSSSLLTDAEHCGPGNAPTDAREHTRQYCSGTTTRTKRYCVGEGGLGDTSSIPADDPCQACTDYKVCSSPSSTSSSSLLTDAEHCGSGNAPTDAREYTRQYCSGTTTRTKRHCVGEGGLDNTSSIPADDPCQACTDYKVCSSPSSSSRYANLLTTKDYCGSGNAPTDARHVTRQHCDSGSTEWWKFCIGENGYDADPGDNPCPVVPCDDYTACSSASTSNLSASLLIGAQHCPGDSGSTPSSAREVTREVCVNGTTQNHKFCIGVGGESSDPSDNPCPACTDYKACSSSLSTSSSSLLTDAEHCGSGNAPTDAREHTRQYCSGTTTRTKRYCVGDGGLGNTSSIPADDPCPTCTDYKACSSSSSTSSSSLLTDAEHCGSGNAPTDAREYTRQYCSGTTTRTKRHCVGEGGLGNTSSIPADDPCPTCTDYKACSSSSSTSSSSLLTDAEHCGSGNAPTNAREHTRQYCSGTTTRTRRYCVGDGGLGNTSSIPADDPCPTCTDYKACSSSSSTSSSSLLTDAEHCGSGNAPTDAREHTRQYCPGTTTRTRRYCVGDGGLDSTLSIPEDDPCQPPPLPCEDYKGCSSPSSSNRYANLLTDEEHCPSDPGTTPDDASQVTREVCVNGTTQNHKFCIGEGGLDSDPDDNPCCDNYQKCSASSSTSSSSLLRNVEHCGSGNAPTNAQEYTRQYCSGTTTRTRRYCVGEEGLGSTSSIPADDPCVVSTCLDPTTAWFCTDDGDGTTTKATNWNETTCAWDTTNGPQKPSSCSAGKIPSLNANVSAKTCSWGWDDESKPCVEGYTHSWSTTRCSYRRSTAKTPKPACQEPQSEATWSCSSERWEHGTVTADACHANPQNTIGYIYDQWRSTSCTYASRPVRAPSCAGTLEWESCKWECVVIDIQFSLPSLISRETSRVSTEQNLDVTFSSDGSITLLEQLVGPNRRSTVSLGSWATGADVAEASSVAQYRLSATNGGLCSGSSSWAAFSSLGVGVFGEASVGESMTDCTYQFRYTDGGASIGSTRIQLSTQASSDPGMPGQMN